MVLRGLFRAGLETQHASKLRLYDCRNDLVCLSAACLRLDWRRSIFACNGCPFANAPLLYESAGHVGISACELLRDCVRIALEKQHRTIHRIGQRAAEDEFAALAGGPGFLQMGFTKLSASRKIIVSDFIK